MPLKAIPARQFKGKRDVWKRYGQVRMLHTFSKQFLQRCKKAGILTTDGIVGVIETGATEKGGYSSLLRQTLASLPDGTWEWVCHPGYVDADLEAAGTRLRNSRDEERLWLNSPELRQFLTDQKFRLMSYREFAETVPDKRS